MQVHTFIAESASEAVERIRAELGPAAVVLSVRKLPRTGLERFINQEQIEVLAGVDEPIASPKPAALPPHDALAELREEIRQLRCQVLGRVDSKPAPQTSDPEPPRTTDRKAPGIAHILN